MTANDKGKDGGIKPVGPIAIVGALSLEHEGILVFLRIVLENREKTADHDSNAINAKGTIEHRNRSFGTAGLSLKGPRKGRGMNEGHRKSPAAFRADRMSMGGALL